MDRKDHFILANTSLEYALSDSLTITYTGIEEAEERIRIAKKFYEFLSDPVSIGVSAGETFGSNLENE